MVVPLTKQRSDKEELIWGWDEEGASGRDEREVLSGDSDGIVQREGRNVELKLGQSDHQQDFKFVHTIVMVKTVCVEGLEYKRVRDPNDSG